MPLIAPGSRPLALSIVVHHCRIGVLSVVPRTPAHHGNHRRRPVAPGVAPRPRRRGGRPRALLAVQPRQRGGTSAPHGRRVGAALPGVVAGERRPHRANGACGDGAQEPGALGRHLPAARQPHGRIPRAGPAHHLHGRPREHQGHPGDAVPGLRQGRAVPRRVRAVPRRQHLHNGRQPLARQPPAAAAAVHQGPRVRLAHLRGPPTGALHGHGRRWRCGSNGLGSECRPR